MSKTLKKILTSSSALLMLAGVGASMNNTNVNARHRRTHRVYHHRATWHKGAPRAIQSNAFWLSKQSFHNGSHQIPRYKNVIWFQHGQVEMATYNYYRWGFPKYARRHRGQKRGWLMSNGLGGWWNPKYKYVGHHTYKLNAGQGLEKYTLKVHNRSHVSVWCNGQYMGYFHKWQHIPKY